MVFSRQEYWRGVPSPSLAMQETLVQFLGLEDLLEKGKATDSSILGLPGGLAVKESACNVGDLGSISGLGRSSGEEKGYPLQYSGMENSVDCIVLGVAKSGTLLSNFHFLQKKKKKRKLAFSQQLFFLLSWPTSYPSARFRYRLETTQFIWDLNSAKTQIGT